MVDLYLSYRQLVYIFSSHSVLSSWQESELAYFQRCQTINILPLCTRDDTTSRSAIRIRLKCYEAITSDKCGYLKIMFTLWPDQNWVFTLHIWNNLSIYFPRGQNTACGLNLYWRIVCYFKSCKTWMTGSVMFRDRISAEVPERYRQYPVSRTGSHTEAPLLLQKHYTFALSSKPAIELYMSIIQLKWQTG